MTITVNSVGLYSALCCASLLEKDFVIYSTACPHNQLITRTPLIKVKGCCPPTYAPILITEKFGVKCRNGDLVTLTRCCNEKPFPLKNKLQVEQREWVSSHYLADRSQLGSTVTVHHTCKGTYLPNGECQ